MSEKTKVIRMAPATRRVATDKVARVLFSTIKKFGKIKGVTLRKIHEYIRDEYPSTPTNIVRLSNTLEKALAFGAVDKKNNRYLLGGLLKALTCDDCKALGRSRRASFSISKACRSCRKGRARRRRSRSRSRGRGRRRRSRSRRRRRGGRRRR